MLSFEVILITIVMFFLLVGFHEFGHFIFAKRAGILVREFAIGFGPKVFAFKKGETQYTFRLIPFGGYVRMAGEDPEVIQINPGQTIAIKQHEGKVNVIYLDRIDQRSHVTLGVVESIDLEHDLRIELDTDGDLQTYDVSPNALIVAREQETQIAPYNRQFGSKTVGQRALTIFAGPMMNVILAFILFLTFVILAGVPTKLEIGHVDEQSAAEAAGLKAHDIVVDIDGVEIGTNSQKMIETIQASPNRNMRWTIIRDDVMQQISITPKDVDGVGIVGIGISHVTRTPTVIEALKETWNITIYAGQIIMTGLKMLVTLQVSWDDFGGPVRIAEYTGEAASLGYKTLIHWTAILSLYLGIFNLLPFPALDGSRLMFIGLEAVRGKPVNPNRESLVHFIGFAMIMMLMIVVTYNDILRLFKGKG